MKKNSSGLLRSYNSNTLYNICKTLTNKKTCKRNIDFIYNDGPNHKRDIVKNSLN